VAEDERIRVATMQSKQALQNAKVREKQVNESSAAE
jgi:hypothetical protein